MSQPPTVAAYRLDFSRLFADASALYRRCFGPLLALGAVSAVVAGGTGLALVWLYATTVMTAVVSFNPAGLASGGLLAAAVAGLASLLVTVQCGAMVSQVVAQVADGRDPDLRAAWRETTTVVARLLLPCLALAAATWLAVAGGLTVVLNALGAARMSVQADRTVAVSTILALLGAVVLGAAAAVVVTWWLRVKLFLLLPAASLEKLPGFAPVKRSWQLTRGIAGLVFGTLFVVSLAEGGPRRVGGPGGGLAGHAVTGGRRVRWPGDPCHAAHAGHRGGNGHQRSRESRDLAIPHRGVDAGAPRRDGLPDAVTGYRLTPLMSG